MTLFENPDKGKADYTPGQLFARADPCTTDAEVARRIRAQANSAVDQGRGPVSETRGRSR